MRKKTILIALMIAILALPLFFRQNIASFSPDHDVLVVISPHTEFICDEFEIGFADWYFKRTGRHVSIDFRHVGGSTETQRYLDALYDNAFRRYWEKILHRDWSYEVQNNYGKPNLLGDDPQQDTLAQAARRAFLASNISCGIDVLFGGGTLVFESQAKRGQLIPLDMIQKKPEWFVDDVMPAQWAGECTRDPGSLWFGAAFSSYGIIYNRDSLKKLGIQTALNTWESLADPQLIGQLALSDPTKSGASKKTFELIIQEQMQKAVASYMQQPIDPKQAEAQGIADGWLKGLRVIQKIAANARYFTDKSTKPAIDVGSGDCAASLTLDCYGLAQRENILGRGGADRLVFNIPTVGSTLEPDPVALLRGAPHPELARLFIEYILSLDGQKIWAYRAGTPGGPSRYSLHRLSVRKDIYTDAHTPYLSNPNLNPFLDPQRFTYHPTWTAPIFDSLHYVLKAICIDPHLELQEAWAAIITARQQGRTSDADRAQAILEDFTGLSYDTITGPLNDTFQMGTPLEAITTQSILANRFAQQYRKAKAIAD